MTGPILERDVRMSSATEEKAKANRVNWIAAKAYFLALPEERRTLKAVADRFQVSDVRVSQVAKRDKWLAEADTIDRRVERKAITNLVRNRADRLTRTLEIYDRSTDLALQILPLDATGAIDVSKIDPSKMPRIDQVLEKLPGLFRMAELAAGEATDRIALSELQPVLIAFAKIAVVNARPEDRGQVVRELEQASSGLVSLEPTA